MDEDSSWKNRVMIIGGLSGLVIGLITAFLFIKNRPDETNNQKISSADGMKLGFGLASIIKQIAELGK